MSAQKIPIENIYYLLTYAWDHFCSAGEIDVDETRCPDTHNLLAAVLGAGIRRLSTRGMDKGYQLFEEVTPRLRGRIDMLASYRRLTHVSGRMLCEFDELTADTVPNRVLKATCRRLLRCSAQLSKENRREIRHALDLLDDISDTRLTRRVFHRIQLHRNNRHYRLLMHVCQLLYEVYLPEEKSGARRFRDVLQEETIMHALFEKFVLRFARRHCQPAKVRAMGINWQGNWDETVNRVLPKMLTDVTIERPHRKTILDCKFYRHALVSRHDRERLHSTHLYQLTSYLRNKASDPGWEEVDGILLYPAVAHDLHLDFELVGHRVQIHSIDLDQPWSSIDESLIAYLS